MEAVQYYLYQMPSPVYAVGSQWTQPLQQLPLQIFGRLTHLAAVIYNGSFTPTYTTAPTIFGNNNVVTKVDFYDGQTVRFQGGFNVLRMKERIQTGGTRIPDGDTNVASASARFITRVCHMGPPNMSSYPSDYLVPCGMLKSGEIRFSYGALTDISADTTVLTASFRIIAKLVLLDELRIPPIYQYQSQAFNASDFLIAGRGLYTDIALVRSNTPTFSGTSTWAAGDLGNITLDLGAGNLVNTINAKDLWASYADDFQRGDLLGIQGEPGGATDINGKTVNHGTPTAIVSVPADLQPVLWTAPDGRISKCFTCDSQARLKWDGSGTAGQVLYGRHLSQTPTVLGQNIQKALAGTGVSPKKTSIRTTSKQTYNGPLKEYMPWKIKVG